MSNLAKTMSESELRDHLKAKGIEILAISLFAFGGAKYALFLMEFAVGDGTPFPVLRAVDGDREWTELADASTDVAAGWEALLFYLSENRHSLGSEFLAELDNLKWEVSPERAARAQRAMMNLVRPV